MKKRYCAIAVLLMAVLLSGCGSEQTVVKKTPAGSEGVQTTVADTGQRIFSSGSECDDMGAECVKEVVDGKTTGDYIRVGMVEEGEYFKLGTGEDENLEPACRTGLFPTVNAEESDEGCEYEEDIYVCVNCPNGECGAGENRCNCPQDCR